MNAILFSKQAKKAIEGFDKKTALRIKQGINCIPKGDIERLEGNEVPPLFRLRIGKYRVIYIVEQESIIRILKIDSRGDVYK